MRIAVTCAFYPSVGGIETVADLLAHEFFARGHVVEIVATNSGERSDGRRFPFPVYYRPSLRELARIYRRSDCLLQFNLGLRTLAGNFVVRRPVVVSQQGIFDPGDPATTVTDRLKYRFSSAFHTIACSKAVGESLRGVVTVIPNCYDPNAFFSDGTETRTRDMICVARLIGDKGVDIFVEALGELSGQGFRPTATIVGDGPQRKNLEKMADSLGLGSQLQFLGACDRVRVAQEFKRHCIAVVPSRYQEAFGVVALEALASGCSVIVANRGGLPEAAGPCGRIFDPCQPGQLAPLLVEAMQDGNVPDRGPLKNHLLKHTPASAAKSYLSVLQMALHRSPPIL